MANAVVPWPGPVPPPGASNVVMVGCGSTNGVLLKFRKPSLAPLEAVGARIPKSKIEVMAAASRRADVNITPLLTKMFGRILVFIKYLSFRDYLCLFHVASRFVITSGCDTLWGVRINDQF